MARHKERSVRVRPEHPRAAEAAPSTPKRANSLTPVFLWAAGAALAVVLAVALIAAVGISGFSGHSRWGFIACLFILVVAVLLLGAKTAEAFLNWKEPGWQPPPRKDD